MQPVLLLFMMLVRTLLPRAAAAALVLLFLVPNASSVGYLETPLDELEMAPGRITQVTLTVSNPTGQSCLFSIKAAGPIEE